MKRSYTVPIQESCTLYRVVFHSVYVKTAIALLFIAFLIQPVAPVYANEEVADADSSVAAEEEVATPEEPEVEEEIVEEPVAEEESVPAVTEDIEDAEDTEEVVTEDTDTTDEVETSTEEEGGIVAEEEVEVGTSTSEVAEIPETESTSSSDSEMLETEIVSTTTLQASTTPEGGSSSSGGGGGAVDADEIDTSDATSTATTTVQLETATTTASTTSVDGGAAQDEEGVPSSTTDDADTATPTPAVLGENDSEGAEETSASTTPAVVVTYSEHRSAANEYQFAETECVSVGDGSYYCSKPAVELSTLEDQLFVESDAGGDKEIMLRVKGETKQLSHNKLEDAAPNYDPLSETVVWHRLIDGRYQIVAYDLTDDVEIVLTDNDTNDMEPTRAGDYTVWQRWVGDNWEIMLDDGESLKQITNNTFHDVAPHVRGDYVIWHTNNGDDREVAVYEISTGLVATISDTEGGNVQNPRFVLVYDTTFDNGDIVTKGYDFASGEVLPLGALPAELPAEIPSSDSTGETRALIQNKSTTTKDDIVTIPTGADNSTASTSATTTPTQGVSADAASSTDTTTASTTDQNLIDMTDVPEEQFELTEFDVVITPYEASSTSPDSTQEVGSTSTSTEVQ